MNRRYFAIGSVLLFLAIIAVAIDNYDQEWRRWQRAYLFQLKLQEKGSITLGDRLEIERSLNLNRFKVVTDPGRRAEACMACHVNRGVEGFAENPLKDLNELHARVFVLDEMPFDQVGCTACHGGDPLALTTEKAHEHLRDRFAEIFLESLEELSSSKQMVRQEAIEKIRWLTGNDFGFVFSAPREERETAIKRAESWWELHKDTFFAEGLGERESPFLLGNPQERSIEELSEISSRGEPLQFLGSNTCIGCHTNPHPGGTAYIPPSNRQHVERWFQEAFKTSAHPEVYLLDHPFLAQVLITQLIEDPARRGELLRLLETARRTGELPEPLKIEDLLEEMRRLDVTCEACHGPGSEYVPLMMKGLSLEYQGRSAEAAELITKAREIALKNARLNVKDPRLWRIFEGFIAQLGSGPQQTPSKKLDE